MRKKATKSPMLKYTVTDFWKQFPNDDVCLDWLKDYLYPNGIHCVKCDKVANHYRVQGRKSYSCQFCGNHVHPTADTIYHKSSTPLTYWFYAVFLMASTRCGISAKQLERELGVTYKTAWRMFQQIRSMLDESDQKLSGSVEVDETYIGGKKKGGKTGFGAKEHKAVVAGAVARGGSVVAKIIPDVKGKTLIPFVKGAVSKDATIYTDELASYHLLGAYYDHATVNHSSKQWVVGDAHTNTVEGFWSLVKGGLRGVYRGRVEKSYLPNYLNEYAFRYNHRNNIKPMFLAFMEQVEKER
jgi:transposase